MKLKLIAVPYYLAELTERLGLRSTPAILTSVITLPTWTTLPKMAAEQQSFTHVASVMVHSVTNGCRRLLSCAITHSSGQRMVPYVSSKYITRLNKATCRNCRRCGGLGTVLGRG
jgi:hypothetical protein